MTVDKTPTGAAKEIWLRLLKMGEFLPIGNIRRHLQAECRNLQVTMDGMVKHGTIVTRPGRPKLYGVTNGCKVPRFVTVRELLDATNYQDEREAA